MRNGVFGSLGVLVMIGTWAAPGQAGDTGSPHAIKIGVVSSVFRDTAPGLLQVVSQPLKALMLTQTGTKGDLEISGNALSLAKKLKENQVQLGVFHGFEFGWARQQYPDLKVLVICVAHHPQLHAHLVVPKDSTAKSCSDLKGKVVALPLISRGHLHLYFDRRCPGSGSTPAKFFGRVRRPLDGDEALDLVSDGEIQAAVVERADLDAYQQYKPNRLKKLRVLHQSETFPASVIAYHAGSLDEATVRRFREGLVTANQSERGQDLLRMCRISGFAETPADYERLLADIIKAYPAPQPAKEGK